MSLVLGFPKLVGLDLFEARARALFKGLDAGHRSARERFAEHHPMFHPERSIDDLTVHDARLVIAREFGFVHWKPMVDVILALRGTEAQKVARMVASACSEDPQLAVDMLRVAPELGPFDLYSALVTGDASRLLDFLKEDPDIATKPAGPKGWPPILYVTFSRLFRAEPHRASTLVACARMLLDAGADPNAYYLPDGEDSLDKRKTALFGAAGVANNAQLTAALLGAGADPNDSVSSEAPCTETLYHAAEFEDPACLELVLDAKPQKDKVSFALGRALDFGRPQVVRTLLEAGADPNARKPEAPRSTYLQSIAASNHSAEVLNALLEHGADPAATDDEGRSAYHYAVRHGRHDLAEILKRMGSPTDDVTDVSLFLGACMSGDGKEARMLLTATPGLVDDLKDEDRKMLETAAAWGNREAVELFLESGFDPRFNNSAALHSACWFGKLSCVQALVDGGADIESKSESGGTPLEETIYASTHCNHPNGGPTMQVPAEIQHGDYPEIVALLLGRGATPPKHAGGSDAVAEVLVLAGIADE